MPSAPEPPPERTGTVPAADGTPLHWRLWSPPSPRAGLLLSHGLGEHGGRYAHVAAALAGRGVAVAALDHRGHGRSGGWRGHVRRFADYVDDLERVRAALEPGLPAGAPRFLLGHSLGGLIAVRHLESRPGVFHGAILSAPALGLHPRGPRWAVAASGLLSRLLPALPFSGGIDPSELSRDPAVADALEADPLVHARVTPRLFTEMRTAMERARADAASLRLPLLLIVPGDDPIVRADRAEELAAAAGGEVEVRRYPEARHETLNDLCRDEAIADVLRWIEARAG